MSDQEVLIVVSKLKKYLSSSAGLRCSGDVAPALSGMIRQICDTAAANAQGDKRQTVKARDLAFPAPPPAAFEG